MLLLLPGDTRIVLLSTLQTSVPVTAVTVSGAGILEVDYQTSREDIAAALQYIAENEEMRDVLLTGGDASMLSDKTLD